MAELPYHHDWPLAFEARMGIRLHWFGRYAGYPDWSVERSRLMGDMVCFFFVERESCWVEVNGVRWMLKAGDLMVVQGGDEFFMGHDPRRPHTSLSAALALERGNEANLLRQCVFERRTSLAEPDRYVAEFEKVLASFGSRSERRDLLIAGAIAQWLAVLLDMISPGRGIGFSEHSTPVDRILAAEQWAMARLADSIAIKEWAGAVGLNSDYFARVFRRHTGRRPMEWLNERRLQRASQLLLSSRQSLMEIAERCGFRCPFYLSKQFKRHYGQSPAEYRRTPPPAPSEPGIAKGDREVR
jgi:AraC-like DNA-binding protein